MYSRILFILALLISTSILSADLFGDNTNSNTLTSQEDEITINDVPLSYKITITGSTSRFLYDLLHAGVTIKNNSNSKYELEYKFVWYDEEGFEMGKKVSKWKNVRIDAMDTIVLKALATTSKIDSFKFYLRDK